MVSRLRVLAVAAALVAAGSPAATAQAPVPSCVAPAAEPVAATLRAVAKDDPAVAAALACATADDAPIPNDAWICPILASAPGYYGYAYWTPWGWVYVYVIYVGWDGDVFLWNGSAWELWWDCPPYVP